VNCSGLVVVFAQSSTTIGSVRLPSRRAECADVVDCGSTTANNPVNDRLWRSRRYYTCRRTEEVRLPEVTLRFPQTPSFLDRNICDEVLVDATACTARARERWPMDNGRVVRVGITSGREAAPVARNRLRKRAFGRIECIAHEQGWTEVVPKDEVHIQPMDYAIGNNRIHFVIE
jgi:hypothetical protein